MSSPSLFQQEPLPLSWILVPVFLGLGLGQLILTVPPSRLSPSGRLARSRSLGLRCMVLTLRQGTIQSALTWRLDFYGNWPSAIGTADAEHIVLSTIDRPLSNENVTGRDYFAFTWPANDQARVWHISDLLTAKTEDRRLNPGLLQLQLIPDSPTSTIWAPMIGDIWFDLIVRLSGPPLRAPIEIATVLPRVKPAPVSKSLLAPPIPQGMIVDYPMDELDAFLAQECVYSVPVPVPSTETT